MSSFNWADLLALARELWDRSEPNRVESDISRTEALRRLVVSRAYYSAFHAAMAYVKAGGRWPTSHGNDHDKTWGELTKSRNRQETLVGNKGDNLKRLRVAADYWSAAVTDANVFQALQDAKKIRQEIDNLQPAGD